LGVGLFDATQTVFAMRSEGMHHAWVQLFLMLVLSWLPWALATPLVIDLGRRYPPLHLRIVWGWLAHLGTATGIGLIFAAWIALLTILLSPWGEPRGSGPFVELWLTKFYYGLLASLILYSFIVAVSAVLDSKERIARQEAETARLNEQLSKTQLDALRRQIEPHFLFNTLNAIAGLVRERQSDAAVSMIVSLSDFLRQTVEDPDRPQVPLDQEVESLRPYLAIQKARFAGRLQLKMEVPRELAAAQVPSFLLQPLVENAIKHGIAKRAEGGTLRIAASRRNRMLNLSVYNDGPTIAEDSSTTRTGIGLCNLRTRLQLLYGDAFELTLRNHGAAGVETSVSVPYRET
jgi:two-component system LytT family sensor kinase